MQTRVLGKSLRLALVLILCLTFAVVTNLALHGGGKKEGPPEKIQALLKERMETITKIYDATVLASKDGKVAAGAVYQAKLALLNAKLEMATSKDERIKLLEEVLKETEGWEKQVLKQAEAGQASQVEVLQAHLGVLEARLTVEIAKQPPPGPSAPDKK